MNDHHHKLAGGSGSAQNPRLWDRVHSVAATLVGATLLGMSAWGLLARAEPIEEGQAQTVSAGQIAHPIGQQSATEQLPEPIVLAQNQEQETKVLPEAPNVDLSQPVPDSVGKEREPSDDKPSPASKRPKKAKKSALTATPDAPQPHEIAVTAGDFVLLDKVVLPATTTRLSWEPDQSLRGIATPIPVLIAHGKNPGPVLCLTGAIHGDELNGIEIVREVLYNVDVEALAGTVVGVPIVNLQGFRRGSRYLIDRRDLNRFFPGQEQGSSASRLAASFFAKVIKHCDALIDLHTGSFYRTNLPQLRADLTEKKLLEFTRGFGDMAVLHSAGAPGTLRRAAVDAGILAVTLEAGEPMRLSKSAVAAGVEGVRNLMNALGMIQLNRFWDAPQPVYYRSEWVRAEAGGVLFSQVRVGDTVAGGDILGVVTDPVTNLQTSIIAPIHSRVIGMAIDQVVLPGFAAFHLGAISTKDELNAEAIVGEDPMAAGNGETADEREREATPTTESGENDPEFDYD